MAYSIYYGKKLLYDPFSGDTLISYVQLTGSTNAAAYLDFTIAPNHLLIDKIQEKGENVEVYSDKTLLFRGYIENITENFDKSKDVSCVNALAWLNDIKLRPYSTDQDEVDSGRVGLIAPGGLDALFDWYIQQYNERQPDVSRHFRIRVNQADRLTEPNWADITQTGFANTGEEIDDKILSYGGYLSIAYSDSSDELLLDLYADAYEANNQVIDFGVNLLDYTKEITTDNQYTAIIPLGATLDLDPEQPIYCHIKYSETNPPASKSAMKSDYSTYVGVYADYESSDYNGVGDNPSDADIINHYTWSNFEQSTRNGGLPIPCVGGFSLYLHVAYASSDDGFTNFSAWNYSGRAYMGYYVDLRSVDSGDPADYGWTPRGNALGPSGNQTYQPPSKMSQAVNLSSIPDGVAGDDADFYKKGDAVYSISAVDKYGYREMDWSNNNISDPYKLRDESVVELRKNMDPEITLTIKAIDLALFMDDGYDHLDIGQAARVRSRPHNIDEYLIVSDIVLDLSDPSNTSYTLGHGVDTLTGKTSGFITALNNNTNKALDRLDPISEEAKNAAKDAENAANAAGKAVVSIQEQFYQSDSPTELTGGSWQPTNIWVQGKYTWRRSYVTYGNMETEYQPDENGVCISGNTGEQGIPGPAGQDGQDGKTTYFHIKYSNVSNPTEPDQLLEVPAEYIGTYVDFEEIDSTDPTKYTWSKFEGTDGEDGIPGTNGLDGNTSYLHIAYATSADGTEGFSTTESEGKTYIGQYVDFTEEDSLTPSSYSWSKIKGEDGADGDQGPEGPQGPQGPPGEDGAPGADGQTSYFHIKYSHIPNPTDPDDISDVPNTYIGTYVDFNPVSSTNPADYTWMQLQGSEGPQGIPGAPGEDGAPGVTSYLHIAYATAPDGSTGFSTTDSEGKTYLGTCVDTNPDDPETPSSYTWVRFKGDQGDQGPEGPQGPQGPPGQDGQNGQNGKDGQMIYCTCTTSGSITAKVATPIDATVTSLYVGMTISVKFTYANTASSPTLNLSDLGAKPILVNGVRYAYWAANMSVIFVYDGTNWNSCSVPVYANTATIGNPVSKNVYIDGTGVDIRNGTTVLSSFAEDEIHLGLDSNEAMIYLADDTVSLTSAYSVQPNIATGTEDVGPGLYIECPGNQPLGLAFRGINSYGKNAVEADQYLGFYNNHLKYPSGIVIKDTVSPDSAIYMESPDIEFIGNVNSIGDWSYYFDKVTVVSGDFMDYSRIGCIKRPAIVIGTDNQNAMLLSSSNQTLPLTTTYFDWGSPTSSMITSYGGVRLYRSGNYVYVQVGKQSSATDRQVCLWISGTSQFQGVTNSNGALEVNVETYTSGGSIIYNGIEDVGNVSSCPSEGGMFLQLVIPELPVVLRAPTSGTYTYRISLKGRSSNSTGRVQTTRLTVRVQ